jgi:hypothetical protein
MVNTGPVEKPVCQQQRGVATASRSQAAAEHAVV